MRAGLTQAQLSDRCGKAKVQIGRWETGAVAPSLDTLLELVRACGFDLPLMLEPYQPGRRPTADELQRASPERRVQNMLRPLGDRKRTDELGWCAHRFNPRAMPSGPAAPRG